MQWISTMVVFVAALAFGYFSRRKPGRDWEFIQTVPGIILLVISTATFQVEFAQQRLAEMNLGKMQYVCEERTNEFGLTVKENCKYIVVQTGYVEPADPVKTFGGYVLGLVLSVFLDIPPEALGLFIGIRLKPLRPA